MPFSVRLDPDTEAKIRRLAHQTGRSQSSLVREAIAQFEPDRDPAAGDSESALDRVRRYAGVVDTGGAQYSTDTHAKHRAARARRRGRAR